MWVTTIRAIDPTDGRLKTWAGPHVPGATIEDARRYCRNNYLGYCEVTGEIVEEIEAEELMVFS